MNWSKVKSVMIVFLILVNLSFLTYIIYEEVRADKRNEQMAETVTALLDANGIRVDKKLVAESAKTNNAESNTYTNIMRYLYTCIGVSFLASIIYDISWVFPNLNMLRSNTN